MSDWDDVFAMAAGEADLQEPAAKKPRKATLMETRTDTDPEPSEYLSYSGSFDEFCLQYQAADKKGTCRCNRGKGHHFLTTFDNSLTLYTAVRNLRFNPLENRVRSLKVFNKYHDIPLAVQEKLNDLKKLLVADSSKGIKELSKLSVIMKCDALYYRLYYSEIHDPASTIPHPQSYFGDIMYKINKPDLLELPKEHHDHFEAFSRYFVVKRPTHALERLHQLRLAETTNQIDFIQDEWVDSCRDFLCHLYCYATVPGRVINELQKQFGRLDIVEVGSGTGYLAQLLGNVRAHDIAPTATTENEYHDRVPPFCEIRHVDELEFTKNSVLLLCYPPPKNDMAFFYLQRYHRFHSQPQTLIHIGEFKGLTGTSDFEAYLVKHYRCEQRWPCLSWGSDASEVSVWKQDDENRKGSVLVPCLWCGNEAAKRCKTLRILCYCSRACFENHGRVRTMGEYYTRRSIPDNTYDASEYFEDL